MAPIALDQFQQCVVGFPPERSLVVSACAGSGKSTTLALRTKALVGRWAVPADRILVLTFSTRSRADLTSKISEAIVPPAPTPTVATYHAHALSILRASGMRASIIARRDAYKLMKELLTSLGLLNDGDKSARGTVSAPRGCCARGVWCMCDPNPDVAGR